ncbi:MAG: amidohydrolase family protein [Balneolaceae bacterium]|nr:amidohydrolase family protein [Balneolaceae bacterium]
MRFSKLPFLILCAALLLPGRAAAQADTTMTFEEYDPVSTLVVPENPVHRAKFPFVDVHNHQWQMSSDEADLATVAAHMDTLNMRVMVNLSGGSGERISGAAANIREQAPGRFLVFANLDFDGFGTQDWTERTVKQLEEDVANGAQGLKIFKNLGLTATDADGNRIPTDHPDLDPVWAACGQLGIPVLIHTGEPAVFWAPIDRYNERWLEMKMFPNRHRDPDEYPSWEEVMSEQWHVFEKHPETTFINAHLGWMGNDLARLGDLLDTYPNVYTEIAAVIGELGRQPRFARQFFIDYQDRIMFGKDTWRPEEYYVYFRVLETADEYFEYYRKRHAFWRMYGMDLPDEVLRKVYYKNALKVIPGIDESLFPSE